MTPTPSKTINKSVGNDFKRHGEEHENTELCTVNVAEAQRDVVEIPNLDVHSKVEEHDEAKGKEKFDKERALLKWQLAQNNGFQHYYAKHKTCACSKCSEVKALLFHECNVQKCRKCVKIQAIYLFHQGVCKAVGFCSFCASKKPIVKENTERGGNVTPNNVQARAFNFPTPAQAPASLFHRNQETIIHEITQIKKTSLIGTKFVDGQDYGLGMSLGKGGNGQVFEANLLEAGMIKLGSLNGGCLAAKIANVSPREVALCKKLANVPNVQKVLFIVYKRQYIDWEDSGTKKVKPKLFEHLMFMPRAEMSLLDYRMRFPNHILCLKKASFYWSQVVKTVSKFHALDPAIVHKDIKSSNVLLTPAGQGLYDTHLADFEFAIMLTKDSDTAKLKRGGTWPFIAPEVLAETEHGTPADIYSLGVFFLELAIPKAATPPSNICWADYKNVKIQELKDKHLGIGVLIEACLRVDPKRRPQACFLLEQIQKYTAEAAWW